MKISPVLRAAALSMTAACCAGSAFAQSAEFPSRPIHLVSGFAPGGATDLVSRIVAPGAGDVLGQTDVVENKPGASGNNDPGVAAHPTPNGYSPSLCNPPPQLPAR